MLTLRTLICGADPVPRGGSNSLGIGCISTVKKQIMLVVYRVFRKCDEPMIEAQDKAGPGFSRALQIVSHELL